MGKRPRDRGGKDEDNEGRGRRRPRGEEGGGHYRAEEKARRGDRRARKLRKPDQDDEED